MKAFNQLKKLQEDGVISFLDLFTATSLAEEFAIDDEEIVALILYLFIASKWGHLCASIENGQATPALNSLIEGESLLLEKLVASGAQKVSETRRDRPLPLVFRGSIFYLPRAFEAEKTLAEKIQEFLTDEKPLLSDEALKPLFEWKEAQIITGEQFEAIQKALNSPLSFLCGGPGTGKTYTAAKFLTLLAKGMSIEERNTFEIALVSPTGKAAVNLEKSLSKNGITQKEFPLMETKTLHNLLKVKEGGNPLALKETVVTSDLIIIDEASMIGAEMFAALLKRVKKGSRLFFIGDPNQLPPIESGHLFADLVKTLPNFSHTLTECKRVEVQKLLDLSVTVNLQDPKAFEQKLKELQEKPFIEKQELKVLKETIDIALNRFPVEVNGNMENDPFSSFRILTALKKGPLGADNLNQTIFKFLLSKNQNRSDLIIPIIVTKNDYALNLFNGDTGVLQLKRRGERFIPKMIVFPGSPAREIPPEICVHYEYAFALSIHKSQGSEYQSVLALFPEGSESFGKEILYTAITRAKKELSIFGKKEVLEKILSQKSSRLSGLSTFFA